MTHSFPTRRTSDLDWNDPGQPNRAVAWQQGPTQVPEGKHPPNIILIVADDLGYNDISLNGGGVAGVVKTPNIDALAREGVNFTTAYAANATCSPSRAAMIDRKSTRLNSSH